jgi:hypothetical protein
MKNGDVWGLMAALLMLNTDVPPLIELVIVLVFVTVVGRGNEMVPVLLKLVMDGREKRTPRT